MRCIMGDVQVANILKIARMATTHWPHQHFELLSFLAHTQQKKQWRVNGSRSRYQMDLQNLMYSL